MILQALHPAFVHEARGVWKEIPQTGPPPKKLSMGNSLPSLQASYCCFLL